MHVSLFRSIPFFYKSQQISPSILPLPEAVKNALPRWETFQCREMTPERRAQWINQWAKLPASVSSGSSHALQSNPITQFAAQFWGVLYKVFSLPGRSVPMITAYEIHCMILAYFNLGNFLFISMKAIAKMAATRKIAVLSNATLVVGFFGSMWIYTRYFGGPNQIEFCKHLKATRIPYFTKQDYSVIQANSAVVIHGEPGVRKSTYVEGISAALKNKRVFQIKNSLVFTPNAPGFGSAAEKMSYVLDEAKKKKDSILICDEFGDATVGLQPDKDKLNANSLEHLGQMSLVLKESPQLKIVIVMLTSQWNAICKADKALAGRFKVLHMEAPDKEEKKAILNAIAREEASQPVDKAAIKEIIAMTERGMQFRESILFFRALIQTVSNNRKQLATPKSLEKARQAYALFEAGGQNGDTVLNDPTSAKAAKFFKKEAEAKRLLDKENRDFATLQGNVANYVRLDTLLSSKLQERNHLARQWVQTGDARKREVLAKQIDYIHFAERVELEKAKEALKPSVNGILLEINAAAVKAFGQQCNLEAGIPIAAPPA